MARAMLSAKREWFGLLLDLAVMTRATCEVALTRAL